MDQIILSIDYPAKLAQQLKNNEIDIALLPVAAMLEIPGARVISNYGIAADGDVASVAIFSHVPIEKVSKVYLDYQSRTSVALAKILLRDLWKKDVQYLEAGIDYISKIENDTAGVIIGDRALEQLGNFEYIYDLSAGWKALTGLDFIFAAWVANKEINPVFVEAFEEANRFGIAHSDIVVEELQYNRYSLTEYYTKNIIFELDERKLKGMKTFLDYLS